MPTKSHRGDVVKMKGFSLVELMIVLAIIGVISSIAYPSYQGYIEDTFHGQAQADVKACGMVLERFYGNEFTYDDDGGARCTLWSPASGIEDAKQYDLEVEIPAGGQSYTITATPDDPPDGTCEERSGNCSYTLQSDGTESIF